MGMVNKNILFALSDHLYRFRKGRKHRKEEPVLPIVDCQTFYIGFTLKSRRYCCNVLFETGCFAGGLQLVVETVGCSVLGCNVKVVCTRNNVGSRRAGGSVGMEENPLNWYFLQTCVQPGCTQACRLAGLQPPQICIQTMET